MRGGNLNFLGLKPGNFVCPLIVAFAAASCFPRGWQKLGYKVRASGSFLSAGRFWKVKECGIMSWGK